MHDSQIAGHLGVSKTYKNIYQRFYWPGMQKTIKFWIKSCEVCASQHSPKNRKLGELFPLNVPMTAGHTISMDILGPLSITERNNRYVLVIIDHLTKWIELVAISNCNATTISQSFIDNWICRHGIPMRVITDRANYFIKSILPLITKALDIEQLATTAYHPQSDGQTERVIQFIINILSKIIRGLHNSWDVYLQIVAFVIRTHEQNTTKFSPFELTYGRKPKLPIDTMLESAKSEMPEINETYVTELFDNLQRLRDQAHRNIEKNKVKDIQLYNQKKNMENPTYKVKDKVWVFIPAIKQGQSRKFTHKWYGPFTIEEILSPVNFKLSNPQGKHIHDVVHAQRLKPYIDPALRPTVDLNNTNIDSIDSNENYTINVKELVNSKELPTIEPLNIVDHDGNSILDDPEPIQSYTDQHHKVNKQTPPTVNIEVDDGVESILAMEMRWSHGVLLPHYLVKWIGIEDPMWMSSNDLTAPKQIQKFLEENDRNKKEKLSQESREMGASPPVYNKTEKRKIKPVHSYINQLLSQSTQRKKKKKNTYQSKKQ